MEASLDLDCSQHEGGGQCVRVALALSAILGRTTKMTSIRAKRSTPGLGNQHLAGARLVSSMVDGRLEGDALGSCELTLVPAALDGGKSDCAGGKGSSECAERRRSFESSCGTAGSTMLMLQAALPVALLGQPQRHHACPPTSLGVVTSLTLAGGTNVQFSPPVDHTMLVLQPLLRSMGAEFSLAVERRGFYPRGGGVVHVQATNVPSSSSSVSAAQEASGRIGGEKIGCAGGGNLAPLRLLDQGVPTRLRGVATGSGVDDQQGEHLLAVTERQFRKRLAAHLERRRSSRSSIVSGDATQTARPRADECRCELSWAPERGRGGTGNAGAAGEACGLDGREQEGGGEAEKWTKRRKEHRGGRGGGRGGGSGKQPRRSLALTLALETSSGAVLSASALWESGGGGKKSKDRVGGEKGGIDVQELAAAAIDRLFLVINSGACLDEHTSDQLVLYASLAAGDSALLVAPEGEESSLHLLTSCHFCETLIAGAVCRVQLVGECADSDEVCRGLLEKGVAPTCRLVTITGSPPLMEAGAGGAVTPAVTPPLPPRV